MNSSSTSFEYQTNKKVHEILNELGNSRTPSLSFSVCLSSSLPFPPPFAWYVVCVLKSKIANRAPPPRTVVAGWLLFFELVFFIVNETSILHPFLVRSGPGPTWGKEQVFQDSSPFAPFTRTRERGKEGERVGREKPFISMVQQH